jgi:hypothetical protein
MSLAISMSILACDEKSNPVTECAGTTNYRLEIAAATSWDLEFDGMQWKRLMFFSQKVPHDVSTVSGIFQTYSSKGSTFSKVGDDKLWSPH